MIVDGKNAVLGRMASAVAKKLLDGETVEIVNSEQVIITGNPKTIEDKYVQRRQRGDAIHGPFYPKTPDKIVRRTIRGMLNYKKPTGRAAFKKLKVHIGVPIKLKDEKTTKLAIKPIKTNYMRVGDLSRKIGWGGK